MSRPEFAQHEQRHNLPALPIPIIGRERHIAAVREALSRDDVRLFTLTGPPGTGKTRLALEVATSLVGEFRDGVYFVDLSSIEDHHLVAAAIAQELALREVDDQPLLERLQQALAERQMLLVLDNFEQLLGAAPDVAELLRACPWLKILITSQAGLRLHWEREYPVPPLELPDVQHLPSVEVLAEVPAVALFVSRAQSIQPQFRLTEANARSVAEVCVSLDGLPLAIELAASRTRTLSPETLLPRLQRRLETLQGGARDLRARHQTLRAAIGWSYSILEPAEKTIFRRLGVFAGGIGLAAAAAVAGEGSPEEGPALLERLESLVGKSLLQSVPEPDDNP
ncbi:MAG TPA: AAA family ATPase, partial [Chloroflexota bacterium]|nr:AAA family ATPase [Chloroflexota bacterium]